MPIFEFRCDQCDSQFELLVRGSEVPLCTSCGSQKLEKMLSAPAGHVSQKSTALPVAGACPPSSAPPCHPQCCRIPQ